MTGEFNQIIVMCDILNGQAGAALAMSIMDPVQTGARSLLLISFLLLFLQGWVDIFFLAPKIWPEIPL